MNKTILLACSLSLVACAADSTKGTETGEPIDGKLDSFRRPTDHGAYDLTGPTVEARITEDERYHTWTLALSGPAEVTVRTSVARSVALNWAGLGSPTPLDTVLYLYVQESEGNWGRYVRKNDDDAEGDPSSRITYAIEDPATLRFLVKGFNDTVTGPFGLSVECSGDGCEAAVPAGCAFEGYDDWSSIVFGGTDLEFEDTGRLRTVDTLTDLERDRIIAAAALHFDGVDTFEDAESHILLGMLDTSKITVPATGQVFEAYTYTMEATAYDPVAGAIFPEGEAAPVAKISEDWLSCED
jgi:hypothetical protein